MEKTYIQGMAIIFVYAFLTHMIISELEKIMWWPLAAFLWFTICACFAGIMWAFHESRRTL